MSDRLRVVDPRKGSVAEYARYRANLVRKAIEAALPTISVHLHCTACGGRGMLGGEPCHCRDASRELGSRD